MTYLLGAMVSILAKQAPSPADRAHRVRVALAPATQAELHELFRERFGVAADADFFAGVDADLNEASVQLR